ncbi:MAG: FAD-dependent oxidoreductase [Caldilinea sp.]|uniref:FAD-dependent oxidoreductase n=1 Tax=Caldilinea sp. TaxID=2293560 RepID=UPI002C7A6B53|nr:FAD-dependent oxidoreductase [Anaerolineales bacterium]HQY90234.1 FAD-dependent oxidoreductase [Caldilinea sp.]
MTATIGTTERPLRAAIVGAGPSGFYTAAALLKQEATITVDMFERLIAQRGLVRYGVAPDHQNIKAVAKTYDRTAAEPSFRYFGNVEFGKDITHDELKKHYDVIFYTTGAQSDRHLGIPGEDLPNSMSATEFVAWYNGHPDYQHLAIDLSCEAAIVVGVGNVAMDVARILAKSVDELADTDIADYALAALAKSNIKDIYIVARRGPAQVKFTNAEIREMGHLAITDAIVLDSELRLDRASSAAIEGDTSMQKNLDYLRAFAEIGATGKPRRVHFRFLLSPVEIIGENGKIVAVKLEKNELRPSVSGDIKPSGAGQYETIPAGLVLRSVGYKGVPLEGVPFDQRHGVIPNEVGRVTDLDTGKTVTGEYVAGWIKRGPNGVIGTNKPDAIESVNSMLEDLQKGKLTPAPEPDPTAVPALLHARGVRYVTQEEWKSIEAKEVADGKARGKPRIKIVEPEAMLAMLDGETA